MSDDDHERVWLNRDFTLEAEGFSQWTYNKVDACLCTPGSSNVLPNGYLFACQHRMVDRIGSVKSASVPAFGMPSALFCALKRMIYFRTLSYMPFAPTSARMLLCASLPLEIMEQNTY